ncbi:glycoside hydrolase domain-containing protein [Micromonospora mangrovi]|uniref:glycoside hydrolase domain-containing protein n=1 Tax=Micromonospora mangrovi TaxID=1182597 RepID=UPI00366C987B
MPAGKQFVVRYGGPGSDGKQLQPAELRELLAAGIAVVANAEGTASGFRGRTAGRSWAQQADSHFRGLGMPADRPIYFSADWDVRPSEMDDVDEALRGAADVIGAARVGLYGGYNVIRHAQAAGTARWFWQTYAWSGGRWAPGIHLQQYRNGVQLAGGTVDLNRAMVTDFGQWGQKERLEGVAQMFCRYGDRGENVRALQYALNNCGFVPGTIDGVYGDGTAAALKQAEASVGVTSDGRTYDADSYIRVQALFVRRFSAAQKGDPGPKGPAGPVGPQGPKGDPGPAGGADVDQVLGELGRRINAAQQS